MYRINTNYQKLPGSYLFSTIAKKVAAYTEANPDKTIIRLGIGDVTQPLTDPVIKACTKPSTRWRTGRHFAGMLRTSAMRS